MDNLTRPSCPLGGFLQVSFLTLAIPVAIIVGLAWAAASCLKDALYAYGHEVEYIFERSASIYFDAWKDFWVTLWRKA